MKPVFGRHYSMGSPDWTHSPYSSLAIRPLYSLTVNRTVQTLVGPDLPGASPQRLFVSYFEGSTEGDSMSEQSLTLKDFSRQCKARVRIVKTQNKDL